MLYRVRSLRSCPEQEAEAELKSVSSLLTLEFTDCIAFSEEESWRDQSFGSE